MMHANVMRVIQTSMNMVRHREMTGKKTLLLLAVVLIGTIILAAGYVAYTNSPLGIIARGNPNAGTWHDDPKNWNRAFGQDPPEGVSVVHSYYWESDHFTHEFIYFFEVKASHQWLEAFLRERKAEPVAPQNARRFEVHYDGTPDWFVPDPIESYDVWDKPGYHGSIWEKKSDGHIYFYGVQL